MSDYITPYISGRQKNLKIGVSSYTDNTTALQVIGNVEVSGILTANRIVSTTFGEFTGGSISGTNIVGTSLSISGISSSGSYYIGTSQVISSGRQLQNILSLDSITTATIEEAIKVAPNDFNSLNISGISTLQSTTLIGGGTSTGNVGQVLQVTGINSSVYIGGSVGIGTTNLTSKLTIIGDVLVSGVVTATRYFGNIQIGTPSAGFQSGAVAITTDSNTNDIVDYINNILGKLVPKPPTTINGVTLTLTGLTGTGALCAGFTPTNNAGISVVTPTAGTTYNRNITNSVSTTYITQYGPGSSGIVTAFMNDVGIGTTTLSSGVNDGTYGSLQIINDKDAFFSTRNTGIASEFYEVYDARIVSATAPDGFNCVSIRHFDGGNNYITTKPIWYEDPSTVTSPIIGIGSTTTPSSPVLLYSSGIPHYTESANNAFTYVITCTNATGDMYSTNTFCTTAGATSGFQTPGNKSYTDFANGVNPPVQNYGVGTGVTALASQVPVNTHIQVSSTTDKLSTFTATTPYGNSGPVRGNISQTINIMGSTATTAKIDEDNILITSLGTGSGNSTRVNGGLGVDNPTPIYTAWSSSTSIGSSESVIVGGVLKYDATNYSTGFLPVGPDYSTGRAASQYIQFEIIRSNVSQFRIIITGTYAGCWVCMPDNSTWTTSLSGKNGWADMFVAYKGSGVPTTSQPGCASGTLMSGSSGTFTSVFGTESSSNDTNNRILVRIKLTSGQSITALSFSS